MASTLRPAPSQRRCVLVLGGSMAAGLVPEGVGLPGVETLLAVAVGVTGAAVVVDGGVGTAPWQRLLTSTRIQTTEWRAKFF